MPRCTVASATSGNTTEPEALISLTSAPSGSPTRSRSSGWRWAPAPIGSLANDGDIWRADRPVVQLAADHQPVVVAARLCADRSTTGKAAAALTASTPSGDVDPIGCGVGVGGYACGDRGRDVAESRESEVVPEQQCQLGGDHPVGASGAVHADLLFEPR